MPAWLKSLLIGGAIVTLLAVSSLMALTVRAAMQRPLNQIDLLVDSGIVAADGADPSVGPLRPVISITDLPTDGGQGEAVGGGDSAENAADSRVTTLVMGIDSRPGEGIVTRTDSMILISVDEEAHTASMLSIPRDLYVDIPDHGRDRINTAFVYGARNGAEAGTRTAMATVAQTLGIPVDHYVVLNFNTVIDMIDTVGGVTVDVPFDIYDPLYPDMNYGYDPFSISAGTQTLDGITALKYMRTRHSDNDFYRARRQQQVIFAYRARVLDMGMGELVRRAPALYQQIGNGVFTDLSLEQILTLARVMSDIDRDNIASAVLDYDYVSSFTTPGGASVLLLDEEKLPELIATLYP
jgi:LCP family protein required for cell wall assembly